MQQEDSKGQSTKEVNITQVIGDVAGCISTLTAKGFNEDSKTVIVDSLLSVISNITKYSRHMELQLELGVSREHEAVRLLEKFKKIAKQQKTVIDTMSDRESKRLAITTSVVETNTSLTSSDMMAQEDEMRREIAALRERLARRTEECRKIGSALKKSEKSEKKLRRVVQRSQEIMHAQEALLQGPGGFHHQMDYSGSFKHYKESQVDDGNHLYLSADSSEEPPGDVDYNYGHSEARRGLPPPARNEPPVPGASLGNEHSSSNQERLESYGVFSGAKARARADERIVFEITEEQVGTNFHDSASSQHYFGDIVSQSGDRVGVGSDDEKYVDSEPLLVDMAPVTKSPTRIIASSSPERSPRRSPIRSSVESDSPQRSPTRSSAGPNSPLNPKEAVSNFVEKIAEKDESDLDLELPFVTSKGEINGEVREKSDNECLTSRQRMPFEDDVRVPSTSPDSSEISPKSRSITSPFEEIDSLEDSFSLIQKYY